MHTVQRALPLVLLVLLAAAAPARTGDSPILELPFSEGASYECTQGVGGARSHSEPSSYHAYDFSMPEGTPVLAAAAGRVVAFAEHFTVGGPDKALENQGNHVILDHGRGYYTRYEHLAPNGVHVQTGELVEAGQVIGLSGNTGYTSGPHLHFHLHDVLGHTLPSRFAEVGGDGVPKEGRSYTSKNDGVGTSPYLGPSTLPPDAFADGGIMLAPGAPACFYRWEREYVLEGSVADASVRSVVFFVTRRGERMAVAKRYANVDAEQGFRIAVRLADFGAALEQGNFKFAVAIVGPDGKFHSEGMPPIAIAGRPGDEAHAALPFPAGTEGRVLGVRGDPPDALLLAARRGREVVAPLAGRVIAIDRRVAGEPDAELARDLCTVWMDHGDGLQSALGGLRERSLEVELGAIVRRGAPLGAAGGWRLDGEPHVALAFLDTAGASLPVPAPADAAWLEEGVTFAAAEIGEGAPFTGDTALAPDAFSANGIELVSAPPAHRYVASGTYRIEGRVLGEAAEVAFVALARGGTREAVALEAEVSEDGAFAFELDLSRIQRKLKEGAFDWALTALRDGRKWRVEMRLPLVVVP